MAFEKCPACLTAEPKRVRFTLWGGIIGPTLLSLVQCNDCGTHYNGKSGRRVEQAIRLYTCLMLITLILLAASIFYLTFGSAGGHGVA